MARTCQIAIAPIPVVATAFNSRRSLQEERYDHLVRDAAEGERIRSYIEQNPVRAGLVREASQYRRAS